MNKIISKRFFSDNVAELVVEAPLIARSRRAGHFVIIRVDANSERVPLTIAGADIEKGTITLVVQQVGASTHKLLALNVGDSIHDVVGPLGRATRIEKYGTVVCACGGVGAAPMLPIAEALKKAGNKVITVLAARNKDLLILRDELAQWSDEVIIMTDDGSAGQQGVVTVGVEQVINREKVDKCITIGPAIMMKFVALTTAKYNIPTEASLNTIMVDGTGMCGACRVTVGGKTKFVCVDGPEFDAHEVDWTEMLSRMKSYKAEEAEALEAYMHMGDPKHGNDTVTTRNRDEVKAEASTPKKQVEPFEGKPKDRVAIPRVQMPELRPEVRVKSLHEEVNQGLTFEQAITESHRCLNCKNPTCVQGCPVNINIPGFIKTLETGDVLGAAAVIKESSSLPAVCGRVCPQEKQCESQCIHLKMGHPAVAIGYLERFCADYANAQSQITNHKSQITNINPQDLFILLYTSGSTGVPKGCQLEHRNLVAFCHWYHRYYDLHAGDKVAAYASYGFDANMMDMYPALTCGAAVYIIGEDIRLNLPDLNHYFEAEGITHSFMTTQVGYQFAQNCDNHSLKHLSVGGEKLATIAPPANYLLHNAYGPTECTIFTTTYPIHEQEKNIPIGKPLDNFRLFIVDKDLHRVPVGATGELLVSGPQVSRGYLNRPDKTAETYVEWNGLRCYRTGDVVRYLEDGNIQFVGRQDGQVKIRGFRIELKEVEAVIREYPGIKDATVQAFDYPNGGKYIAAYIVSDTKIDIQALNAFIRDRKPPYMVPASTMQIDVIPLNQNQKVNKRALPVPQLTDTDRDYVAPTNDNEKLFCDIFASILNQDKIGATDNFFELGGTSLMVTRVIIEADKAGKHVAYGDIFTHPTPRLLSQFLSGDLSTSDNSADEAEEAAFDYSGIDAILQRNNLNTFLHGERQELGNVLLTGATGYLGIHVLRELIDSDAKTITCLVRGKDQHDAQRRLRNLLFYYFDRRFDELFGSRLFVVNGDVTSDINDQMVNDQMVNINTVFNCAANVKHFSKTDDIEQVNIGGAERCVEFCLKTGARLVHISTTSVGEIWVDRGDGKAVPELSERLLYFGQFLDNRYMRSKFLAERVILEAVARHGLNAKVMRVGNLAARSYDGEFQANFQTNSYMGRLKVFSTLGCCLIDEYDSPAEFSPVNETAKAVVLLASTPKECNVFQPFNNHTDLLGDILAGFEKIGKSIRYVEEDEFQQAILEASKDPKKASLMSALLAYQDMTHGQKAVTIERDNRYTSAVLLRLGFHWSAPDSAYVNRMLTAISQLGFFDV